MGMPGHEAVPPASEPNVIQSLQDIETRASEPDLHAFGVKMKRYLNDHESSPHPTTIDTSWRLYSSILIVGLVGVGFFTTNVAGGVNPSPVPFSAWCRGVWVRGTEEVLPASYT